MDLTTAEEILARHFGKRVQNPGVRPRFLSLQCASGGRVADRAQTAPVPAHTPPAARAGGQPQLALAPGETWTWPASVGVDEGGGINLTQPLCIENTPRMKYPGGGMKINRPPVARLEWSGRAPSAQGRCSTARAWPAGTAKRAGTGAWSTAASSAATCRRTRRRCPDEDRAAILDWHWVPPIVSPCIQHRGVRRNGDLAVRLCLCRSQGQLEYVLSMKPSSSESLSSMFQSLLISNRPCQVSTYLFSDSTHKSFRLLFEMRLVHSEVGSYMNRMLSSQRTARTQRRLFPPAAAP